MNDEQAKKYIDLLYQNELPAPSVSDEIEYLKKHDSTKNEFSDVYGLFAALIAQEWYDRNKWRGVTLARCIRSANTGLILAREKCIKKSTLDHPFKDFAEPYIREALDDLIT